MFGQFTFAAYVVCIERCLLFVYLEESLGVFRCWAVCGLKHPVTHLSPSVLHTPCSQAAVVATWYKSSLIFIFHSTKSAHKKPVAWNNYTKIFFVWTIIWKSESCTFSILRRFNDFLRPLRDTRPFFRNRLNLSHKVIHHGNTESICCCDLFFPFQFHSR